MKRLILTALATLPFLGTPLLAQPAAADVIINLSSSHNRSQYPVRTRRNSSSIKTWKRQRPDKVRQNRRVRQRRQWVPGRWRDRRENNRQVRRVWVPGHYEIR